MNALADASHPSAVYVLAGALLEAALVAIAKPAREAGQWRSAFLNEPPARWPLGKLIDQAHDADLFSDAQFALAQTMMVARNRIHAGRHVEGDKFNPPYTNAHEARLAKSHLDVLLVTILEWPPIRALV